MLADFLGHAEVGAEVGAVAVGGEGVDVAGAQDQALQVRVLGRFFRPRMHRPVQVHIGLGIHGGVGVAVVDVATRGGIGGGVHGEGAVAGVL